MFSAIKNISNKKKSILLITLILIIAITFETAQQLYYIKRYNIAQGITFFELLKTQSKSWLVWIVLSFPLIHFIKIHSNKEKSGVINYVKYLIIIIALAFLSIFIIAVSQLIHDEGSLSLGPLFNDYFPFYTFQKFLIFTLGYSCVSAIIHAYFSSEQLLFKVQELNTLKETHTKLYEKLSREIDDKATILNIKLGNKRKIIAVEHILWIEADDYCVKVHTENGTYTMRSSLKALEEKLDSNFLRVHRKAIVNMKKVKEFSLSNAPILILENNSEITVSKSNLKMVRHFIS